MCLFKYKKSHSFFMPKYKGYKTTTLEEAKMISVKLNEK